MKRNSLALVGGAVVLAAGAIVAVTNPMANAGESGPRRDDLKASLIREDVSTSLGEDYAGIWIDKDGDVKVALTDESKVDEVTEAGAEPKLVKYGKRELDDVMDVLNKRRAPATVHKWFVEPQTNSVVVEKREGAEDEATREWVDNALAEHPAVRVVEGKNAPQARAVILGGDKWEANGPTFCSTAFAAVDANGGRHALTAGHCFTEVENDVVNNAGSTEQIGTYDSTTDVLGEGGDIARLILNDQQEVFASVNLYNQTVQPITGSTEVEIGAEICRSGAASGPNFGTPCGTILRKDATINTNTRNGTVAVTGQTETDICTIGGDSGGAFFSGDQAQGILSAGTGTCGEDATFTSNFTPVNTALTTLGLTLLTS